MYEAYWQLTDKPFRNTPDPHYLYFAKQYEEALTRMLYAVTEGQGAMLLTGEVGCGKTMLSRAILDELDPERYEVALVPYPNLSAEDLLREILGQFGYEAKGLTKAQLLQLLTRCLNEHYARGCMSVIMVDEGQMVLDEATLEELRLLLNFQQDRRFFLALILMGQPELRERVEATPQFLQRLNIRYHVGPLDEKESLRYINHRLAIAGGRDDIFTREAETLVAHASAGVPRRINSIADTVLLVGCGQQAPVIDEEIVQQVLDDLHA